MKRFVYERRGIVGFWRREIGQRKWSCCETCSSLRRSILPGRAWPSSSSSSSSRSVRGVSWEGQAGLFLSILRKAVVPLNLWSRFSPAGRNKLGGRRGRGQQSQPIAQGVGWRIRSLYPSFFQCCDPATPVSRAGIQPLCLWQQQREKEAPGELQTGLKAEFYTC